MLTICLWYPMCDTLLSVHSVVLCGLCVCGADELCARQRFIYASRRVDSWVSVSDVHSSANPGAPLKQLQEQQGLEAGMFW